MRILQKCLLTLKLRGLKGELEQWGQEWISSFWAERTAHAEPSEAGEVWPAAVWAQLHGKSPAGGGMVQENRAGLGGILLWFIVGTTWSFWRAWSRGPEQWFQDIERLGYRDKRREEGWNRKPPSSFTPYWCLGIGEVTLMMGNCEYPSGEKRQSHIE